MQCEVCGLAACDYRSGPAIIAEQRCADCTQFREALDATVGELLLDANAGGIPAMAACVVARGPRRRAASRRAGRTPRPRRQSAGRRSSRRWRAAAAGRGGTPAPRTAPGGVGIAGG